LDMLLGFTAQKNSTDRISAGAADFPSEYVSYISAGIVNTGTHSINEWSMLSLMSRINYSYDGKYLFTATVRRDGSSRFGRNNRWGTFPSFSIGYNISEEPFMQPAKFISNLKLRASYGISGNNAIGNYTHIGLLGSETYLENNQRKPGLIPSTLSNYDLTWERSRQSNFGIELSLFDFRFALTADVYRDHKTDLLLAVGLPAASGFTSSVQNIGDIQNNGFELGIQTVNIRSGIFEWATNMTLSSNKNKVLSLSTEGDRIFNSDVHITQVGYPIGSFYLLNPIGIFKNQEELEGVAVQHPRTGPGDFKFEDVDKNGVITMADRKILGDPWPDYIWGFENRFTFGNLSLGVFLNGQQGSFTYFQAGTTIFNMAGVQNQIKMAENRWRSESEPGDGKVPRAIRSNHALAFSNENGRFLFNSSFTRIKNVNLSYRMPQSMVSRLAMSSLSVFMDVANLYTFTDYPGYDPESSTAGDNIAATGYDAMSYPLPRTYTLGVRMSF
jgi:TonB-dependent starch-binding outer membrane protein SusC